MRRLRKEMKLTIVNAPPTKQCHPDFPSSAPPSAAPAVMLLLDPCPVTVTCGAAPHAMEMIHEAF
jgi:hypothetical protein